MILIREEARFIWLRGYEPLAGRLKAVLRDGEEILKKVEALRAGMGGLIEIHGGEKDGMTYGCISLENGHMDELFELVPLGTPVAIVGTGSLKEEDLSITPNEVGDD
jgi:hypothetical protein